MSARLYVMLRFLSARSPRRTRRRAKYPSRLFEGTTPSPRTNINARAWSHTVYRASSGDTSAMSSSPEIPRRSAVVCRISRTSARLSTFSIPATFEYSRRIRSSTDFAPVALFRYARASPKTASYALVVPWEIHVSRSRP